MDTNFEFKPYMFNNEVKQFFKNNYSLFDP